MKKLVLYQALCSGSGVFCGITAFGGLPLNIKIIACSLSFLLFMYGQKKLKEAQLEEENLLIEEQVKLNTKQFKAVANAMNNLFYVLSHELIYTFSLYHTEFEYVKEVMTSDKTKIEKLDLINGKLLLPTATQFKFIKDEEEDALLDLQLNQIKYIIDNQNTLDLILSNTENKQQTIFNIFCFMYKDYFKPEEIDNNIYPSNRLEEFALLCFKFGVFGDKENGWKIHKVNDIDSQKDKCDIVIVKYYNGNPTYFELSIFYNHTKKIFHTNESIEKILNDNIVVEMQKLGV